VNRKYIALKIHVPFRTWVCDCRNWEMWGKLGGIRGSKRSWHDTVFDINSCRRQCENSVNIFTQCIIIRILTYYIVV
jgi:hypothetical protein